jgi:glycosyl hydrolase family 26
VRSLRQRRFWTRAAPLVIALTLLGPTDIASPETGSLMFGAYPGRRSGQSFEQALTALEAQAGRQLDLVRSYYLWDSPFPTSYETLLRDTGHTLVMSVKARRVNGTRIPWANIAAAQPGSTLYADIVRWAARVKNYGVPLYFVFNHEPEEASNDPNGTSTDFIAAWRKVISVFRAEGVTNASYVWTATSYSFWRTDRRRAALWYPGDEYVDQIAADAYNWYNCRPGINNPWWSLQQIIEPLREFGRAHPSEGLMLLEFASYEDPAVPGRKAQWLGDAQELFKQPGWEQFEAILYYNAVQSPYTNCKWWIDTSQSSLDAFQQLANDPFYGGDDDPAPAPSVLFSDDFSTGNFTRWSGATNLTIDATTGSAAPPSARGQANSARAWAFRALGSTHPNLCQSMRVNLASVGANSVDLLRLRTAADGPIARVYVTSGRTLWLRSDASGQQLTSGRTLPSGWNEIELCARVGTGGSLGLALNGSTIAGPWTANLGATWIGRIQVGDTALKTWTAYFDDVVVTG